MAKPMPKENIVPDSNLALWERLFSTDPAHTKTFKKGGGFGGTAIKPFWCVMRATEEFGPVGKGWGWNEVEHLTFVNTDGKAIWFSKIVVWYMLDGQRYETGPQWGATELVAKRSSGEFLDEEAAKKAVTDGLTKCLSYLGLAGDVHMGLFDDSKYVEKRKAEEKEHGGSVVVPAPATVTEWRDRVVKAAKASTTTANLQGLWEGEKGNFNTYAKSEDAATKAAANYVKSEVMRKLAELKAEAPQASQKDDNQDAPGAAGANAAE